MSRRGEEVVYSTKMLNLVRKRYGSSTYYYIKKAAVVSILPVIGETILLERQYRTVVRGYLYEVPAGHIEKGESPIVAARRELEEETGYRAGKITRLSQFFTTPGISDERNTVYVATNLKKGKLKLDKNEHIAVKWVSLEKALAMIDTGEIVDAKTIIALLCYAKKG